MTGTYPSPVLKAVAVLVHVASAPRPVTLTELSVTAGLPKPTAHRLAGLLERAGLVRKDPLTRRYVVGPGLIDLGFNALRNAPAHRERRRLLEDLSARLAESINLAILAGDEVLYLDRVECAWPLRTDFRPGTRVPVHCTANGKLLLAHAPPSVRARILRVAMLEVRTDRTRTSVDQLTRELAQIRRQGYSEDDEEFLAGVRCLAVPIRDRKGRVIAGLAVSAPSARFTLERARSHLGDLRAAADAMGAHLDADRRGARGRDA